PPAQLTLDPLTANAELQLSQDLRSISWEGPKEELPPSPERFQFHPCVLGSRGFSSGWHCWEVEVSSEGLWAIGVATTWAPRQSRSPLKPEEGVWALCHNKDGYKALTSPNVTSLDNVRGVLRRIRVCVDCEEGRVVFSDLVKKAQIFAFQQASFKGEPVYPWFLVMKDAHVQLL
ncbi:BT2A2 protein, partial [Crotophaga sulcirostris]|nr:BT2A2 protein [Crotophaga sulcirostris]